MNTKTHAVTLYTKDGQAHNLELTGDALLDLKRHLRAALYDAQGRPEAHPTAEIVVYNASSQIVFRQKATDLLRGITTR